MASASRVIAQGKCDGIESALDHHSAGLLTGAIVGGEIANFNVARGFETPLKKLTGAGDLFVRMAMSQQRSPAGTDKI